YREYTQNIPLLAINSGTISVNKLKLRDLLMTSAVVLLVAILFVAVDKLQLATYINVNNDSALVAFLLLGLVASISSCAALVGGLILSLTQQWQRTNPTQR